MEVEVTVDSENFDEGTRVRTGTAFVTLVALDKRGKATEVPQLLLKTKDDKRRFEEGKKRMEQRLREAGKI
jgi:acyl-CoA hydrolase